MMSSRRIPVCSIWYTNGACKTSDESICRCLEGGVFEFRRTVRHNDSGLWIWQIYTEPPRDIEVIFEVLSSTKAPQPDMGTIPFSRQTTEGTSLSKGSTTTPESRQTSLARSQSKGPSSTLQPDVTKGSSEEESKVPSDEDDLETTHQSPQLGATDIIIVVLGGCGIFAVTAIVIAIIRCKKEKTNIDIQQNPEVKTFHVGDNQAPQDIPDYDLYWEINEDELSASSATPHRAPQLDADGYMTPVPSRAVVTNTDGARNVIPMYHNSRWAEGEGARACTTAQTDSDGYLTPAKPGDARKKLHLYQNTN
ncbi:hypothetical protein BaRGS_00035015 [Batillaria attramentaria]|uniref:Uncharacterized protein n=1 Tax=Batillaria attramentaria TaxID=370345 RepID=A0ABD0JFY5_9CAEN